MTSPRFDVAVVGGGLVGLASARALRGLGAGSVVVLEAAAAVGTGQSGRNSGVLHAGLYYRPDSSKARLCREGRGRLERYCEERGLPWRRTGKLVVATREAELEALSELERRAAVNGLEGVRRIAREELSEHEPHVRGLAALHVPETGVVDFSAVARSLAGELADDDVELRTSWPVRSVTPEQGGFVLQGPRGELRCRRLLGCAGLGATRLARASGLEPATSIVPFRGEYYRLRPERAQLVRGLVYPVPDPRLPFLGVHLTRRVDGVVEVGPNAVPAFSASAYRWRDVRPADLVRAAREPGLWRLLARYPGHALGEVARSASRRLFVRSLRRLLPDVSAGDLAPATAGIRAQALTPTGQLVEDFLFEAGPGQLHVLSAPSPAATACLAIGEEVARGLPDGA